MDPQTLAAQAQARYALAQTILGGAGLIGTLVLLYYTKESLAAARKAADAAHDAVVLARTEQRAWIGVSSIDLQLPVGGDEATSVEIAFTNSGSTPALDVVLASRLVRWPNLSLTVAQCVNPDSLEWPNGEAPYAAVVLPGVTFKNVLVGQTVTGLNGLIRDGLGRLCIFGEVRYRDVSGGGHFTRFAYWYNAATGRLDAATLHNSAS